MKILSKILLPTKAGLKQIQVVLAFTFRTFFNSVPLTFSLCLAKCSFRIAFVMWWNSVPLLPVNYFMNFIYKWALKQKAGMWNHGNAGCVSAVPVIVSPSVWLIWSVLKSFVLFYSINIMSWIYRVSWGVVSVLYSWRRVRINGRWRVCSLILFNAIKTNKMKRRVNEK